VRYLVAIPIYNEEATLVAVLRRVRRFASDILVIDDGSTDQTPRLIAAEQGIRQIRHVDNRGYGQSLIDAFAFARREGYDWLITMDCDEQHEPACIPEFIAAARANNADIISGSRYVVDPPEGVVAPPDRRAINQKITDLLNELLGLELTDAFCGFKAYRVSALSQLSLNVPGYGMPLQLWVQAACRGLRIREIPVPLIYNDADRSFGETLDEPDTRVLYYYEVLVQALGAELRRSERPALPADNREVARRLNSLIHPSC
jgi:dolichol-phosphate mannosyltransferase